MPNDSYFAGIARELAQALIRFARERRDDDKKAIAALHTSLCAAYREEMEAVPAEAQAPPAPTEETTT